MSEPVVSAPAGRRLLRLGEVAAELDLDVADVRELIRLGGLASVRLPGQRERRVRLDDVRAYATTADRCRRRR